MIKRRPSNGATGACLALLGVKSRRASGRRVRSKSGLWGVTLRLGQAEDRETHAVDDVRHRIMDPRRGEQSRTGARSSLQQST